MLIGRGKMKPELKEIIKRLKRKEPELEAVVKRKVKKRGRAKEAGDGKGK